MNGSNESGTDRIRVGIRCPTPWSAAACSVFAVDACLRQRAGALVRAANIGSGPPTAGQQIQAQQVAPEEIAPVQSGSKLPHSKLPCQPTHCNRSGKPGRQGFVSVVSELRTSPGAVSETCQGSATPLRGSLNLGSPQKRQPMTTQFFRLCHMEASKSMRESESLFQETVDASRGSLPSIAAKCNCLILSRRASS